jgi:methionyl-tRNA synthetase
VNSQFDGEVPQPESLDGKSEPILDTLREKVEEIAEEIEDFKLQAAANTVIAVSRLGNQYLNEKEPWNLIKKDRSQAATVLHAATQIVKALAIVSAPFIPFTADEIWKALNLPGSIHEQKWTEALKPLPPHHKIAKVEPLFRKVEEDEKELDDKLERIRISQAKTA